MISTEMSKKTDKLLIRLMKKKREKQRRQESRMKDIDDTAVQEFRIQGRIVPALTSNILGFFSFKKYELKNYHYIT